jgi:two-component system osmolarity sensor histidine kinase EnvZ
MVMSSLVLLTVAVIYLRNQVRPIQRLARAAESFGKGRDVPDFRPAGAAEVRAAAQAFLKMRERIERHIKQRTEMLAGVSHDLRTPLTRLKLELALMPETPERDAMHADVEEMERMLSEYLAFARGQGVEAAEATDLSAYLEEIAADHARHGAALTRKIPKGLRVPVRRNAFRRMVVNLLDNAETYGDSVRLSARRTRSGIEIAVEDDGPGIPPEKREEAFRPFHRLDEARSPDRSGVGLGLAIARDIARGHGGDLELGKSDTLGGLKATVRLPV